MDVVQVKQYFVMFCIFVIGMIIGRLTMAIQYEVMRPKDKAQVNQQLVERSEKTIERR